jgi:putative FmdB family regulatory protein
MPTYEYRCPDGHEFEKFYRKISDAGAEVPCPQCGKIAERKLSAGAGLVFKGSGFYITDYGKDGKKDHPASARPKSRNEAGGDSAPSSSGGESSGGGDAKPASDAKPVTTESKPASTKETTKKESGKSEPAAAKPSKPSTE